MRKILVYASFILALWPLHMAFSESTGGNPRINAALLKGAETGNIAVVRKSLESGADANTTNRDGNTPLMWASEKGHTEIVRLLIAAKANVNADEKDGWTALMEAAAGGHLEIGKLLIEAGANVKAHKNDGATALMLAANNGHTEFVKMLLAKGASVNIKDKSGRTALHYAASFERIDILGLLVAEGADLNAVDADGVTPLIQSATNGQKGSVKFLIEKGANVNLKTNSGYTALKSAFSLHQFEIVELLKKSGAIVDRAFEAELEESWLAKYRKELSKINAPYLKNLKAKQERILRMKSICMEGSVRQEETAEGIMFIAADPESGNESAAVFAKKNFRNYLSKRAQMAERHQREDENTLQILPCGRSQKEVVYKTKMNLLKSVPTLQAEYLLILDKVTDEKLLFD